MSSITDSTPSTTPTTPDITDPTPTTLPPSSSNSPSPASTPEPPPIIVSPHPAVYDLLYADLERMFASRAKSRTYSIVLADFQERDYFGLTKYGVRLQPHNGRRPLVDLYQELLDAVVYCRQAIHESLPTWPTPRANPSTRVSLYADEPLIDLYRELLSRVFSVRKLILASKQQIP